MAPPNGTPKAMSSRLLNMKFMQRAAASDASTPITPAEPAAKKQRLSNGSFKSTPVSTPQSEAEAPTPEEQRREEAFAREAAARGDSKWYLSFQEPQSPAVSSPLRIVSAGYGALDSAGVAREHSSEGEENGEARPQTAGRRSFGKFSSATEVCDPVKSQEFTLTGLLRNNNRTTNHQIPAVHQARPQTTAKTMKATTQPV